MVKLFTGEILLVFSVKIISLIFLQKYRSVLPVKEASPY